MPASGQGRLQLDHLRRLIGPLDGGRVVPLHALVGVPLFQPCASGFLFVEQPYRVAAACPIVHANATKPPARQNRADAAGGVFPLGTSMAEVADLLEGALAFDTFKRLHAEIGKRIANG